MNKKKLGRNMGSMGCRLGPRLKLEEEALRSAIERNRVEKALYDAEAKERATRLSMPKWRTTLTYIGKYVGKPIIAGVVTGILLFGFCIDHLLAIHQSNEIRLKDVLDREEALSARNRDLEDANRVLRDRVGEFEIQVQDFKKQLNAAVTCPSDPVYAAISQTLFWLESEKYRIDETMSIEPERTSPTASSTAEVAGKWVYIGRYRTGAWENSYFSVANTLKPSELVGTSAKSLVEVNIRNRPFNGHIERVLRRETSVRFGAIRIKGSGDEGYVWGRLAN